MAIETLRIRLYRERISDKTQAGMPPDDALADARNFLQNTILPMIRQSVHQTMRQLAELMNNVERRINTLNVTQRADCVNFIREALAEYTIELSSPPFERLYAAPYAYPDEPAQVPPERMLGDAVRNIERHFNALVRNNAALQVPLIVRDGPCKWQFIDHKV